MTDVVSLATAFVFFWAPAGQPAPTPTPAEQPTRHVVFNFTYDEWQENTTDVFGSAPNTDTVHLRYGGMLTFGVMKSASNGDALVSITETTDALNNKKPLVGDAIAKHSGTLDFGRGQPPDELSLIMPYLAVGYFGDRPLQKGSTWQMEGEQDNVQLVSTYTVTNATDDTANIDVVMQTKRGYLIGSMTIDEKLAYRIKASVPSALDVEISRLTSGPDGVDTHTHYHFRLASDTGDAAHSP